MSHKYSGNITKETFTKSMFIFSPSTFQCIFYLHELPKSTPQWIEKKSKEFLKHHWMCPPRAKIWHLRVKMNWTTLFRSALYVVKWMCLFFLRRSATSQDQCKKWWTSCAKFHIVGLLCFKRKKFQTRPEKGLGS